MFEIDYNTKIFGIIGKDINYTLSPYIHNFSFNLLGINGVYLVFDLDYTRFEKAIIGLLEIAEGLNITIPYKETIMKYLDWNDEITNKIGAANTVLKKKGYNTDYIAIISLVKKKMKNLSGFKCYIYGAGGAAKAASFSLAELGCYIKIINRTINRANELVNSLTKAGFNAVVSKDCVEDSNDIIVVNSTPDPSVVKEHCVEKSSLVIDFVYRPIETELIKKAKANNIPYINGLEILVRQAVEAQNIWFNKTVPDEKIIEYLYARKLIW
ncbi:MAG: shikimate dehydrogenase [Saccharolobus sp.]